MALTESEMEAVVCTSFQEILQEQDQPADSAFDMDTVLLDSGLDSLGFAILVSKLEEKLGFDPSSEAEVAYYPETFEQLIVLYIQQQP